MKIKSIKKLCLSVSAIFLTTSILLSGCTKTEEVKKNGTLTVYTSIYPMYDFSKKIGGNKVNVVNMIPNGVEPHDWEPSPKDIVNVMKSDVLIYNGEIENWVDKITETAKGENLVILKASKGIKMIEGDDSHENSKDNESHEGHHHSIDPHVWLNPQNAKIEMKNIKDTLSKVDPKNKGYYEENYNKYAKELDTLDKSFKDGLSNKKNKNILVSHEAFGYICDLYGIKQTSIEGLMPDSEPDAKRMAGITRFVRNNNIKYIFSEASSSEKVAESIAGETGIKIEKLSPIESLTDEEIKNGDDYFSIMYKNLEALKKELI
ncbi:metal ABC transporter substrate-binding protein [Peptostreptococcus faecalis]|uniref:metal ABC transporter substrate-binding protein n=1 Tax=Peptostreptococcus faecalis TaxID=2045015 RepID=UPI001FA85A26|nr:metal ABC transporter substrate-binding protein [Peptostreptococcus faecalis]